MLLEKLINLQRPISEIKDYLDKNSLEIYNENIIFVAIDNEALDVIDLLLKSEIDFSKYKKNKLNPFLYSVKNKKYKVAEHLSNFINIDSTDDYEQSFLYFLIDHDYLKVENFLNNIKGINRINLNAKNNYNGNDILMECALSENKLLFRFLINLTNSITYNFDSINFEGQNLQSLIEESEATEILNEYNKHFFTNNLR